MKALIGESKPEKTKEVIEVIMKYIDRITRIRKRVLEGEEVE